MPRRRSLVATVSALALGAASAAALAVTLDVSPAGAVTGSCAGVTCPQVTGSIQEGQILTTSNGTFTGATTFTYRWQRCTSSSQVSSCNDIPSATNYEYVVATPDVAPTEFLRVVVTGHDANSAADEPSDILGPVQSAYGGNSFPATGGGNLPPSITDTTSTAGDFAPRVGDSLTSTTATWSSPAPNGTIYQWTRCNAGGTSCVGIPGVAATGTPAAYIVTAADLGSIIRMRARGANANGTSEQYSSGVGPVEVKAGSPTPTPSAGGDHKAPQTRFTSKPATTVKSTGTKVGVRFTFAADEPSHFQCKLDKGTFKACKSPAKLLVATSKAGTKHTLKVRAIDTAGNVDPTPSSFTFTAKRITKQLARA